MYLLIIFFITLIIPCIVIPRAIKAGDPAYRTVLRAALTASAGALAVFIIASINGQGVYQQLNGYIEDMAKILAGDATTADLFGLSDVAAGERADIFAKLYREVFKSLPAAIMIFSAIIAYFEYIGFSKWFKRRVAHVNKLPRFREFSLPSGAVWAILLMYLISWIMTSTEMLSNDLLYVNMDAIFDFVFSLQGISVVFMFFHMKGAPKAVSVIVIAVLWISYIGRWMLVLLGMFDMLLGLKSRIQNNRPRM